jgi:hypothetical protein
MSIIGTSDEDIFLTGSSRPLRMPLSSFISASWEEMMLRASSRAACRSQGALRRSLAPQRSLAPPVEQTQKENHQEDAHVKQRREPELLVDDGPGVHERHLHVEGQEEQRVTVVAHVVADPDRLGRELSGRRGHVLGLLRSRLADRPGDGSQAEHQPDRRHYHAEQNCVLLQEAHALTSKRIGLYGWPLPAPPGSGNLAKEKRAVLCTRTTTCDRYARRV